MHDIQMRRWDGRTDLIIEQTLDGNIHYTHNQGAMLHQGTIEVEDNTVDLTAFKRSYAKMELGPALENAGYDVLMPEPETSESFFDRIAKFIRG